MRIRKFNESSEKEIDSEYIKQCFMDFFDNGTARMQSGSSAAKKVKCKLGNQYK